MNLRYLTYFLCAVVVLSCNRVSVDYEETEILFSGVDAEKVDSIFQKLSVEEQIGMLCLWKPQINKRNLELLPQYFLEGSISGYLLDQVRMEDYKWADSLCQEYAPLPPLDFSNQGYFYQHQFLDLPAQPTGFSIATVGGASQDLALQPYAPGVVNHNCKLLSPFLKQEKMKDHFGPGFKPIRKEELVTWSNQTLLTDQKFGFLSFQGPLDFSIYPRDSNLLDETKRSCLYSLVKNGLSGISIDPILIQEDTTFFRSPNFLHDYLKNEFEFSGLLLLETNKRSEAQEAFLSGVDLIMVSDSLEGVLSGLEELVFESRMAQTMLKEKVKKIIRARLFLEKRNSSLDPQIEIGGLGHMPEDEVTDLETQAITIAHNPENLLPLKNLRLRRFKLLDIGVKPVRPFRKHVENYSDIGLTYIDGADLNSIPKPKIFVDRPVIVFLNKVDLSSPTREEQLNAINVILKNKPSVVVNIGYPYNLDLLNREASFVQAYSASPAVQRALAEVIFGGRSAAGKTPVQLAADIPKGSGFVSKPTRLSFGKAEEIGIPDYKLVEIDVIAKKMIRDKATPGCQVLIAKDGKVIYNKSFGYLDSLGSEPVSSKHLYDVASITKVAATTLSAMRLFEQKKFKVTRKVSSYLPWLIDTELGKVAVKDLLTHRSGVQSNMPMGKVIFPKEKREPCNEFTCSTRGGPYQLEVTNNMYFNVEYQDTIFEKLKNLSAKRRRFRYSDVNFILLQRIIESQSGMSLDRYVSRNFFRPLNLRRTSFRPRQKFKASQIAPTAMDARWREKLIRGYVHDESAALMGGVAGNAGLFSNTMDLAVLGQLLLNKGTYGGVKLLEPSTVEYFTKSGHGNHRGLGFDKLNRRRPKRVISKRVSSESFGHTGFTGCLFWVDPEHDLVFVINTNRIHPDVNNRNFFKGEYRRKMQDVIYKAIDYAEKNPVFRQVGNKK
ncbi:MAG: serine hydrolase [Saprospiraceae bacterium]|nr:serine hydrolase [Saprospiraceae bacterium]